MTTLVASLFKLNSLLERYISLVIVTDCEGEGGDGGVSEHSSPS